MKKINLNRNYYYVTFTFNDTNMKVKRIVKCKSRLRAIKTALKCDKNINCSYVSIAERKPYYYNKKKNKQGLIIQRYIA